MRKRYVLGSVWIEAMNTFAWSRTARNDRHEYSNYNQYHQACNRIWDHQILDLVYGNAIMSLSDFFFGNFPSKTIASITFIASYGNQINSYCCSLTLNPIHKQDYIKIMEARQTRILTSTQLNDLTQEGQNELFQAWTRTTFSANEIDMQIQNVDGMAPSQFQEILRAYLAKVKENMNNPIILQHQRLDLEERKLEQKEQQRKRKMQLQYLKIGIRLGFTILISLVVVTTYAVIILNLPPNFEANARTWGFENVYTVLWTIFFLAVLCILTLIGMFGYLCFGNGQYSLSLTFGKIRRIMMRSLRMI